MDSYGFGVSKPIAKSVKRKKYTRSGLFAMSKSEQIGILRSLGVTKIPKKEANRVKKILELV